MSSLAERLANWPNVDGPTQDLLHEASAAVEMLEYLAEHAYSLVDRERAREALGLEQ